MELLCLQGNCSTLCFSIPVAELTSIRLLKRSRSTGFGKGIFQQESPFFGDKKNFNLKLFLYYPKFG